MPYTPNPNHLSNEWQQKKTYQALYHKYGASHQSLHWSSLESQQQRFAVLTKIGDLNGAHVLDIGCGFGDFFGYLKKKGIVVQYTGWDIVTEFIITARAKHPEARFELINPLVHAVKTQFDYVVMSGVFAFGDIYFFRDMMKAAHALAKKGFGFNVHIASDPKFFRLEPQEALNELAIFSDVKVTVMKNYMKNDFTCFATKLT